MVDLTVSDKISLIEDGELLDAETLNKPALSLSQALELELSPVVSKVSTLEEGSTKNRLDALNADKDHTHAVSDISGLSDSATTSVSEIRAGVTKSDVGLDLVNNVSSYSKTESDSKFASAEQGSKADTALQPELGYGLYPDTDKSKLFSVESGAQKNLPVIDNLLSIDTDNPLSANQGRVLKGLVDNINTLLSSDDTSLDELQEIVDFIKLNRADLDSLSIDSIAGLSLALDSKQPLSSVLTNTTASFTSLLESKLDGISSEATSNQTDAHLLNRVNHTGTQPVSTISGLSDSATTPVSEIQAGTTKENVGLSNIPNATTDSRTNDSPSVLLQAKGMSDHISSGDHDTRYYTKTEIDLLLQQLTLIGSGTVGST